MIPSKLGGTPREQNLKADAGKPRWELVPFEALEGMVRVLEFGERKYSRDGWKQLNTNEDKERVIAALLRHTFALMRGETIDPESGMPHVWHMQCNTMFLGYFQTQIEPVPTERHLNMRVGSIPCKQEGHCGGGCCTGGTLS